MCGSKPQTPAHLPERASVCGHGSLQWRVRVCFAGLIGRLFWLQLCTGAGTPSGRWGSSCETPLCPPTGARYTAPMVRCLPPTAAAGPCAPAPGDAGGKACPCRQGLAEILELDEAKLLEKFNDRRSNDCLLRYRVERETADAVRDFCAANGITGVRINQDSKRWYHRGSFWPRCWGSPT